LAEAFVLLRQVPPDVASRTIDFVYDPDADTADEVAEELANQFNLSSTDRDICAAALKEWIAKEAANGS
jgi:WNK lysine deficient protein kinase